MNKKFTIVICNPTEPIGLGQKVYGGVVSAAYDRELSDAQPAVAVNQRMRTALQEIANTVNYAQWYQETAEKALEDANPSDGTLDKVSAAVAVNEHLIGELRHIAEYWNRDPNERAMADALWHIIRVAEAAIEQAEAAKGGAV